MAKEDTRHSHWRPMLPEHRKKILEYPTRPLYGLVEDEADGEKTTKIYTEEDKYLLDGLREAALVTEDIADSHHDLFRAVETHGVRHVDVDPLGERLKRAVGKMHVYEPHLFGMAVNPWVAWLRDMFQDNSPEQELLLRLQTCPSETVVEAVKACNLLVQRLRTDIRSVKCAQAIDTNRKRVRKNSTSLSRYADDLFENSARICVLRTDHGYRRHLNPLIGHCEITPELAKEHMAKLIRTVKRRMAVLGYAWTLECGVLKGPHFHLVLFLDGRAHMHDISRAEEVKELWQGELTDFQGLGFNCGLQKYVRRGIGMIHRDDEEKRRILMKHLLSYLVLPDFWLWKDDIGLTFVRGNMPGDDRKKGAR